MIFGTTILENLMKLKPTEINLIIYLSKSIRKTFKCR